MARYAPNSGAVLPDSVDRYQIRADTNDAVLALDAWVGRFRSYIASNGGVRGPGIDSITQSAPNIITITWHDPASGTDSATDVTLPTGAGNVVTIDWDGQGATPARSYPTGHPLAGQVLPDPPHVVVRWRSPVRPTGTPKEGDEWMRISDEVVY